MKNIRYLALILLASVFAVSTVTVPAEARSKAKEERVKKSKKKKAASKKASTTTEGASQLGTDFSFNDAMVKGKYQYADEGVVTVEDEKGLVDLLGMRRHFKDRLDAETSRN